MVCKINHQLYMLPYIIFMLYIKLVTIWNQTNYGIRVRYTHLKCNVNQNQRNWYFYSTGHRTSETLYCVLNQPSKNTAPIRGFPQMLDQKNKSERRPVIKKQLCLQAITLKRIPCNKRLTTGITNYQIEYHTTKSISTTGILPSSLTLFKQLISNLWMESSLQTHRYSEKTNSHTPSQKGEKETYQKGRSNSKIPS